MTKLSLFVSRITQHHSNDHHQICWIFSLNKFWWLGARNGHQQEPISFRSTPKDYRLLMKGKFNDYFLLTFGKKLIFAIVDQSTDRIWMLHVAHQWFLFMTYFLQFQTSRNKTSLKKIICTKIRLLLQKGFCPIFMVL